MTKMVTVGGEVKEVEYEELPEPTEERAKQAVKESIEQSKAASKPHCNGYRPLKFQRST